MSTAHLALHSRMVADQPLILPNRRVHKRFALSLLGRFMRASKQEYPCKMIDISVGGVSMMSPIEVTTGERIVAYFDLLGGLQGEVVRPFEGGFAIELSVSPHKREKLAAQITWLVNRDELSASDARRHDRTAVSSTSSLKLAENLVFPVRVTDVSMSGASLTTDQRPSLGTEVVVGRLRARVVRHLNDGIAVQFIDIQNIETARKAIA